MINIKNYFLSFLLFFPLIIFAETPADKLSGILNSLETIQARFVQTILDKHGKSLQQSSGKMSLQRPGKFRWETLKPSRQLLIADGKKIWFYDVDLQQVMVHNQADAEANSPAMLLSGSVATLTDKFVVSMNDRGDEFTLSPHDKSHLFQSVKLRFKNNLLTAMYLTDNLGQSSQLKFSQVVNNEALSPQLFRFSPPKHVDVIQQ